MQLDDAVTDAFHQQYYEARAQTWQDTRWLGVPVYKCPLDLWIYQEIIWRVQPELIVECGTADGGSAYYFASLCDLMGRGKILTIDVNGMPEAGKHPRISFLQGSSTDPGIVREVKHRTDRAGAVMVVLDSDHSRDHVAREIEAYAPLVTRGSYLVVEDTNINGHPVRSDWGPGPHEAVDAFLSTTDAFVPDETCQRFMLTFNPRGWLRRVK